MRLPHTDANVTSHHGRSGALTRAIWSLVACGLLVSLGWQSVAAAETETATEAEGFPWIVDAQRGAEIIDEQNPVLLDTRNKQAWSEKHLTGAVQIDWEAFTPTEESDRGELLADTAVLQQKLRGLGVDGDRPVLVVGNPPKNWGEDGRIVWMLRSLGHDRVALVDGGYRALVGQGAETSGEASEPEPGDFQVRRRPEWSIERDEVREIIEGESPDVVVVDTRSEREYRGGTPYGEERAGHLPGAVHLHYRELLDEEGKIRADEEIRSLLKERGITSGKRIVTYCTGGVRSAWLTVVLTHLGFERAANYAGSAWDWAAAAPEEHPLVVE